MQTHSPILLASDPFIFGGNGSTFAINPTSIINPNREAMLVDEFRFSMATPGEGFDFLTTFVRISLGAIPLTNGWVSLIGIVPTYFANGWDAQMTWHLARPMYVPPDVQVNVEFKRFVPFSAWTIDTTNPTWGFAVAGRSMPAGMEIPKTIYVPWACSTSVTTTTLPFISGDAEIGNPFDTPLHIDYFAGANRGESNANQSTITVQMTLSSGKVLMRDPTPFRALFPIGRNILRMRALMQPKEFVSVLVDVPEPASGYTDAKYTTIGMTGWRELCTPRGAQP